MNEKVILEIGDKVIDQAGSHSRICTVDRVTKTKAVARYDNGQRVHLKRCKAHEFSSGWFEYYGISSPYYRKTFVLYSDDKWEEIQKDNQKLSMCKYIHDKVNHYNFIKKWSFEKTEEFYNILKKWEDQQKES